MKKMIQITSLLLVLAVAFPVWAVEEHHPDTAGEPAAQTGIEQVDTSFKKMQETRQKMEAAKGPAERQKLMHQHMQHMKEGMKMMDMMAGQGMMMDDRAGMMASGDMQNMPMADRMAMMEKKMSMMDRMMGQGGMMSGQGMMMQKCMMGNRLQMMEKRMQMMQEMMKGLMTQQEMMKKK